MQDAGCPRQRGILIKITAKQDHYVDEYADVTLPADSVAGGSLDAITNKLAHTRLAEFLHLLAKALFNMG